MSWTSFYRCVTHTHKYPQLKMFLKKLFLKKCFWKKIWSYFWKNISEKIISEKYFNNRFRRFSPPTAYWQESGGLKTCSSAFLPRYYNINQNLFLSGLFEGNSSLWMEQQTTAGWRILLSFKSRTMLRYSCPQLHIKSQRVDLLFYCSSTTTHSTIVWLLSQSKSRVQSRKNLEWLYSAVPPPQIQLLTWMIDQFLTRFLMFNLVKIFTVDLDNQDKLI